MGKHSIFIRVLAAALSVILLLTALPANVVFALDDNGEDAIQVSSWDDLYEACQNAPDNVSTTIVLSDNVTRPSNSDNDRIEINNKKVIILDLNDKTLHANRTDAGKYYHVLDVHEGGNLTIQDSGFSGTIKGGYANNGGGIYISEGAVCTINGGTISNNYAKDKGGGVYTEGTLIMTQGTISRNCTSSEDGGGIYCAKSGTIQLKNVFFRENEANEYGSGIMIVLGNDDSYIRNCYFEKNGFNYFAARGGGICVDADIVDRTLNITDSLFDNNWGTSLRRRDLSEKRYDPNDRRQDHKQRSYGSRR